MQAGMNTLFEQFDEIEMPAQGKSNEWYTPARYIEAARRVMNGIDLDPASCLEANRIVKAKRYFTTEDDGLQHDWIADNVWLNPPYGRENDENAVANKGRRLGGGKSIVTLFVKKLLDAYCNNQVQQAILLVTTDTDAGWFQPLWSYPICFANHRVLFIRPGMPTQGQFFGTCFVYLGANESAFIEHFSEFGCIAKAVSIPKPKPTTRSLWEL
jgi:phage N-6-adenine-methyltransferase